MDKLDMKTENITQGNIERIRQLFPNAVTEAKKNGKTELAIDFDVLKQELSESLIDEGKERYQMTWPGKRQAVVLANTSTTDTLRPCKEESVDFDNTQNLYIEGDNLNVLKLLRETYLGKIKMIYIDPPYNTGNDSFVYNDCYSMDEEEFLKAGGYYDENGNRVIDVKENKESNGRFHTDWLNMLYPRLRLARDLLTDDGAIFISIGDDEEGNLLKICDEIFGKQNFIANICHKSRASVSNDRIISENHNHLLFYAKNEPILFARKNEIGDDPDLTGFTLHDEKGDYKLTPVDGPGGAKKGNPYYEFLGVEGYWRYSKETMQKRYNEGLIVRTPNGLQQKYYKFQAEKSRKTVTTWWDEGFLTSSATSELVKLMGAKTFDNPKSVNLVLRAIKLIAKADKNSIILDFFSGSATTAHAVMQLNAEDGGNRKFIMVQLPEKCDEKSEAYKAGYKNICEIGKERIRRAGKKIKEENGLTAQNLDTGFRVLKLDSSNMQDVYYNPAAITQTLLETTIDNIKSDRTPLDLLFQVMLELGVPLSAKIEENAVNGKTYYAVNGNDMIACFDDAIDEEVITAIAKQQPLYAVFKDKSFASDSVAINNEQLFKTYSPATNIKVV